jgi:hypothetical protein
MTKSGQEASTAGFHSQQPKLLPFSRVVCRVDVGYAPGPNSIQLNHGFLVGPGEVIGLGLHKRSVLPSNRITVLN